MKSSSDKACTALARPTCKNYCENISSRARQSGGSKLKVMEAEFEELKTNIKAMGGEVENEEMRLYCS